MLLARAVYVEDWGLGGHRESPSHVELQSIQRRGRGREDDTSPQLSQTYNNTSRTLQAAPRIFKFPSIENAKWLNIIVLLYILYSIFYIVWWYLCNAEYICVAESIENPGVLTSAVQYKYNVQSFNI